MGNERRLGLERTQEFMYHIVSQPTRFTSVDPAELQKLKAKRPVLRKVIETWREKLAHEKPQDPQKDLAAYYYKLVPTGDRVVVCEKTK